MFAGGSIVGGIGGSCGHGKGELLFLNVSIQVASFHIHWFVEHLQPIITYEYNMSKK